MAPARRPDVDAKSFALTDSDDDELGRARSSKPDEAIQPPLTRLILRFALMSACAVGLVACATHERFATPPRVLEVYSERRVATLHFPRGSYVLNSEDRRGYYYQAPGGVVEHTAASRVRRTGGIFVSKRNRDKLRGYVIMPYGRTHVGNLSRIDHEFHD